MQTTLFDADSLLVHNRHPARYTDVLLPVMARMAAGATVMLDPFGGTGKIFLLQHWLPQAKIHAMEIEAEWAALDSRMTHGSALALPWQAGYFDAVVTSPCLAHGQKVLRADLRWVPVEEITAGDRLIAFDEFGISTNTLGRAKRRKWRIATVKRSVSKSTQCVNVYLANGDIVTCTPEHPWLAQKYLSGDAGSVNGYTQWVQTKNLIDGKFAPKGWYVHKQLNVWKDNDSYTAGWLAGMFDGEGSLAFGTHGSPKLSISQIDGELSSLFRARLTQLGIKNSTIHRKHDRATRQPVVNIYVNGGFPVILEALGTLRPARLLEKLDKLDVASRCLQATEKIQVLAIEDAGIRDIQEIETSTGTYIGEGYLHHNCYGNRMADHFVAGKPRAMKSYRDHLGHDLHKDNAGRLQWGDKYRTFHVAAWQEAKRVLQPVDAADTRTRLFILNIKDHIRNKKHQYVTDWHIEALQALGFVLTEHVHVPTPSWRYGANAEARVGYESVIRFELPLASP